MGRGLPPPPPALRPGPIAFYIFGLIYQLLPPNSLFFVNGNVWWLVNDFWVISKAWATIALVTAEQGGGPPAAEREGAGRPR